MTPELSSSALPSFKRMRIGVPNQLKRLREEVVVDDQFLSLDQAAAAIGLTPKRLWSLAYRSKVTYRGTIRDPFFRVSQLDGSASQSQNAGQKSRP